MDKASDMQLISDADKIKSMLRETQILFRQQKYTQAKKILQEVLQIDPDNAVAYNNLGSVYLIGGRLTRAERYFKKALELNPQLQDAEENLKSVERLLRKRKKEEIQSELEDLEEKARHLATEKKIPEAIEVYSRIVEQDPTNIKVHNNLGILYFQIDRFEEAERHFVRALEMYFHHGLVFDEQYTIIRENLAKLREKLGSKASDLVRDTFSIQMKESLKQEEEILHSLMGTMDVIFKDQDIEVNTMLAITSSNILLLFKSPQMHHGESHRFEFAHEEVTSCQVIKGIRQNALIVDTVQGKFKIFSKNAQEIRNMDNELRRIISSTKGTFPAAPVKPGEDTEQVLKNVITGLLDILENLRVFTPDEIERKKREIAGEEETSAPKGIFKSKGMISKK